MKKIIFLVCFCSLHCLGQQESKNYSTLTNQADKYFIKNKYRDAVQLYSEAFESNGGLGKVIHRYKAASCYAELGKPDSAFFQLEKITKKGGFADVDLISNDIHFKGLFEDSRWVSVINAVKENKRKEMNSQR